MFARILLLSGMVAVLTACSARPVTPTAIPTLLPTAAPSPTAVALPTAVAPPTSTATPAPAAPAPAATSTPARAVTQTYEVVSVYPHDRQAFTEGLLVYNGEFYESTGLNGKSNFRRVEMATGKVLQQVDLPAQYFGEGIVIFGERLYQLTWQEHTGFVYDRTTFQQVLTFTYPMEGWGMTQDGRSLIISDGTPTIHFYDPQTLTETRQIQVTLNGQPVAQLNELEYVRGEIYANVWQTNLIVRIDPSDGRVLGVIDMSGLLTPEDMRPQVDVLNGIAYDEATDRLFVTGKLWPKVFEIKVK